MFASHIEEVQTKKKFLIWKGKSSGDPESPLNSVIAADQNHFKNGDKFQSSFFGVWRNHSDGLKRRMMLQSFYWILQQDRDVTNTKGLGWLKAFWKYVFNPELIVSHRMGTFIKELWALVLQIQFRKEAMLSWNSERLNGLDSKRQRSKLFSFLLLRFFYVALT